MRALRFSRRVFLEIVRDPLTLFFGLGFPAVLIILLSVIQKNIPVELFEIERLVPGVTVFGLSFMTLFSATTVASDRESALLTRLYATPMRASDFILGYTLPLIPISLLQAVACYIIAIPFGLKPDLNLLFSLLGIIPASLVFIGLGLAFGSILTQKQVGGICGALLTNLTAWLSGVWFDLELVGGVFKKIAAALPFYHAVNMERLLFTGTFDGFFENFAVVLVYALAALTASVILFIKQMKKG